MRSSDAEILSAETKTLRFRATGDSLAKIRITSSSRANAFSPACSEIAMASSARTTSDVLKAFEAFSMTRAVSSAISTSRSCTSCSSDSKISRTTYFFLASFMLRPFQA